MKARKCTVLKLILDLRYLASRISLAQAIAAATYSADNTPGAIDLQGFTSAAIALNIGAGGITFDSTNKIEFVLTHSDDDTTYANVATADVNGKDAPTAVTNGIVKSLTAAHATADVSEIGYIGGKRFLKLLAHFSGTHGTGTALSAAAIRGTPIRIPSA